MKHFTQIPIPISERERHLSGESLTCVLTDSQGKRNVVWPHALEVPHELLITISKVGHVESMTCRYAKDLGPSTMHYLAGQKFFFRVNKEHGVLERFGFVSPVMMGPLTYWRFLDLMERMLDCAAVQPESYPHKWSLIFTVQLVYDEWKRYGNIFRELLSQPPLR